jgi:preprotein translocase subunit YajC
MPEMDWGVRVSMVVLIFALVGVIAVYHIVLSRQQRKAGSRREPEQPRRAA